MSDFVDAPEFSLVKSCYAAWNANDLATLLSMVRDDATYFVHVPRDVLPYGGVHQGKPAVAKCLDMIKQEFDFLAFGVDWIRAEGDTVRARVVYYFLHDETGEQLEGNFRHVWRVDSLGVVRLDEFHDVEKLRAFLHMVRGDKNRPRS